LDAPLIRGKNPALAIKQKNIPFIYALACNNEMVQHKCSVDAAEGDKRSSLVKLLLCLEDTLKKGKNCSVIYIYIIK
jgi:hypothetical protein